MCIHYCAPPHWGKMAKKWTKDTKDILTAFLCFFGGSFEIQNLNYNFLKTKGH